MCPDRPTWFSPSVLGLLPAGVLPHDASGGTLDPRTRLSRARLLDPSRGSVGTRWEPPTRTGDSLCSSDRSSLSAGRPSADSSINCGIWAYSIGGTLRPNSVTDHGSSIRDAGSRPQVGGCGRPTSTPPRRRSSERFARAPEPPFSSTVGFKLPTVWKGGCRDYLPSVSVQAAKGAARVTVTNLQSWLSELHQDVPIGDSLGPPAPSSRGTTGSMRAARRKSRSSSRPTASPTDTDGA